MNHGLLVSVIVPVYNARRHLGQVIEALKNSSHQARELIVVDDASTDGSAELAQFLGANTIAMERQSGPAAARNCGARTAQGDLLMFVDSDVLVREDTIARIVSDFVQQPHIAAVFGSYDDEPAEKNFLSQYKNLCHHFVHQQSRAEAATFWAGCGAVRREVFETAGGFDDKRYSKPSIEDIELGYRLKRMGFRILLDKKLQVQHLKKWNLGNLLRADIFYRAIPWTKLILESGQMVNDLNLQTSQKISAALVLLMSAATVVSVFYPKFAFTVPLLAILVCFLNYRFYGFLLKKRGIGFALRAVPMQFFYYFYSTIVFALLSFSNFVGRKLESGKRDLKFHRLEKSESRSQKSE